MTVRLVCGPPCSGKSTYVREHSEPDDAVIDYDDIAQQLGSPRTHGHDYRYHERVEAIITQALRAIEAGVFTNAWVIRSLPKQQDRDALARRLDAEVIVIDAPDEVLLERAAARPNPEQTRRAIREWRAASGSPISPDAYPGAIPSPPSRG